MSAGQAAGAATMLGLARIACRMAWRSSARDDGLLDGVEEELPRLRSAARADGHAFVRRPRRRGDLGEMGELRARRGDRWAARNAPSGISMRAATMSETATVSPRGR